MKSKLARFIFMFMSSIMLLAIGSVIFLALKKHQERNKYPIEKGIVTDIHALKMGGGTYLVKLDGTSSPTSVDGNAFYKAYAIGEEVEVLMKPNKLRILNAKNIFVILSGIGAMFCFVLSITMIGFWGNNKGKYFAVLSVGFGFIFMGLTAVSLINYGKTEDKVFAANSDVTMGKISGFHQKTCKTKKSPKREYTCYACLVEYPLPDGTVYQFKSDHYYKEKKGNVGDERKMRYLLSNPKEAKVYFDEGKRGYFYLAMYGFALVLILLGTVAVHAIITGK